jgi:hypothetical protein
VAKAAAVGAAPAAAAFAGGAEGRGALR